MKAKKIILAAFAGTALLAAAGAQARDGWRDIQREFNGGHRQGHYNHGHYGNGHYGHYAPRVVVRPAPVYYAPPPRYYAPRYYEPAPVYYEPAPVVYGRIPLGNHSSIGFSLPLY